MTATLDVLAGLTDEVGAWGEHAHEHQWADARELLRPGGTRRQWWGRARGWSKTRDAGAVLLAAVLTGEVPPGHPAYVGASDEDQAGLVRQSVAGFVRSSGLSGRVAVRARSIVDTQTGGEIVVLPADSSGSLGLRPSWAVLDELANWPTTANAVRFFEALTSGIVKTSGRLLVITTAGLVGHWSEAVYRQAKADHAWRVSEVHEPPPWIPAEEIDVERRRLPASTFLRFWRNEWASAEDTLADAADVDRCVGHAGPLLPVPGRMYVMAADLGVKTDPSVAVVMHREVRGGAARFVVDRLQRWVPSPGRPVDLDDVEAWLVDRHRQYRPARIDVESWQAFKLLGELRARGLPAREFVASSLTASRLALAVFEAIRDQALDLPDDKALLAELKTVRLVAAGGVAERFRLDHASGEHNDQAVTVGIGLLALMEWGDARGRVGNAAGLRLPVTTIARVSPAKAGTVRVGRFVVPAEGYRAPRDGRW